jgi:AhpD family alkylhydroperoxidase
MLALERYLHRCGLERSLIELVKLRASQINGCALCIDMHTKDARAAGETEQRLYLLDAWQESPFYSARERAADKELVDLNWVVVAINAWNRLAISFRFPPGTYQPAPGQQRA